MKPFKYQLEFTAVSVLSTIGAIVFALVGKFEMLVPMLAVIAFDFAACASSQYSQHLANNKKEQSHV